MRSICEEASVSPKEGEGWELLYKIVPIDRPRASYPAYRVGHLYRYERKSKLCCDHWFGSRGRRAAKAADPAERHRAACSYWSEPHFKGFRASPCYAFCKRYVETLERVRYLKVLLHVKENHNDEKVGDQLYVLEDQAPGEVEAMVVVCRDTYGVIYHTRGTKFHREETDEQGLVLPAVIRADGERYWHREGRFHRDDRDEQGLVLPAIVRADGTREWWRDGERHRDDRDEQGLVLPAIVRADGTREWWCDGERHRDDLDGRNHILPAVIGANGEHEWWLNGKDAIPG